MSEAASSRAHSSRGFRAALVELAVVLLLGAAVGAAFEAMRPGALAPGKPTDVSAAPAAPTTLYDLPPIVTNLGEPQDVWIRLEGSIIFDPKALPHPEAAAARISDDALAYLRTLTLRQLEGPIGLEAIRQDLNERAATRTEGRVKEFVIRTLVVQ
jgi:flagellar protein FliL